MRKSILALAAVSAMLFALPAVASAESWQIHPSNVSFTTSSGEAKLTTTAGDTVECTSSTGSGAYVSTTTAENIKLKFHGCKSSGVSCHSGSTTGTIETNSITAHNVWANKHGTKTRALLLTPTSGDFATFRCTVFGIGPTITVTGSVIGEVELTKACNTPATEGHLNFESVAGKPGHQTITTLWNTPGTFDLTSDRDGTPSTASQDATGSIKFGQEATVTC
jgi:hypothetical protein